MIYVRRHVAWFRVFGYGLHVRDLRRLRLMYSERNGFTRVLRISPYGLKVLKP